MFTEKEPLPGEPPRPQSGNDVLDHGRSARSDRDPAAGQGAIAAAWAIQ